ncbi:MAG: hypothetical protein AAF387_17395 [Pseudomonadota bacterium]
MDESRWQIAILSVFALVALPACSESSGGASVGDFVAACESAGNMGKEICTCIGNNAKQDLSPKGFEFFTAMMQKDDAKTAAMRAEMEFAELTEASMYLLTGAQNCAESLPK